MKIKKAKTTAVAAFGLVLGTLLLGTTTSRAINIETVTVGDPGNANDTSGYGGVDYTYAMGKYEVTIGQYTAFLNAVAVTEDTYSLYNTSMATDTSVAGISRSYSSGSYSYSVMTNNGQDMPNRPITYVSWFDAARFTNWMANGQPTGVGQVEGSTENGAYTLNGATSGTNYAKNAVNPNNGQTTTFWIPSENEWYKASYYSPGASSDGYWLYPTQSDSAPGNTIGSSANQANYWNGSYSTGSSPYITNGGAYSGSASHYGTYDQGGNVWEWNDAVISGSYRGLRGGSWDSNNSDSLQSLYRDLNDPVNETLLVGFRVASVPEPSTVGLGMMSVVGWILWKRRSFSLSLFNPLQRKRRE